MSRVRRKTKLPDGTTLAPLEVEMLRRVKETAPNAFFHGETAGESWSTRRRALIALRDKGLLSSTRTDEHPPRLLWSLTKRGAAAAGHLSPAGPALEER